MTEPKVYKEVFERILNENDVQFKIAAVKEAHPESLGWIVGEPVIEKLGNGEVKLSIPLAKYEMTKTLDKAKTI